MRVPARVLLAAGAAAVAVFAHGAMLVQAADPVGASASAAISPARVTLRVEATGEGDWRLEARVLDAAGGPVPGAATQFYRSVEFLGRREVPLGSTSTDVTGTATLIYTPTTTGTQQIVARSSGADGGTAEGRVAIDVASAAGTIGVTPAPFPILGRWAALVVVLLVVTVWAVLGAVFVAAIAGVWGGRVRPSAMGSQGHSSAVPGHASGRGEAG